MDVCFSRRPSGFDSRSITFPYLYKKNIVKNLGCSNCLFPDDTSLYIIVESPNGAAHSLKTYLNTISTWTEAHLVAFNTGKTLAMIFSPKATPTQHPPLLMNNILLTERTHTQTPRFNILKYMHLVQAYSSNKHKGLDKT